MRVLELCFRFIVCPKYQKNIVASKLSVQQDVTFQMELIPNKGFWDLQTKTYVPPSYQEITFQQKNTTLISFKVSLEHNSSNIRQSYNSTWSPNAQYVTSNLGEECEVFIKFYYNTTNSTIIETCNGEDKTSKYIPLDPKKWICFDNHEIIDAKMVCDGQEDCLDKSDESISLCKPIWTYFEVGLYILIGTYLITGCVTFYIFNKRTRSITSEKKLSLNISPNYKKDKGTSKRWENADDIIDVCLDNVNENDGLETRHKQTICKLYQPCIHDEDKRKMYELMYTLSLDDNAQKVVYQIFDELMKIELKVHKTKEKAACCMLSYQNEFSYLSLFIQEMTERNDQFTRLRKKLSNCVALNGYGSSNLYSKMALRIILTTLNIGLFYYDIVKDVITLNVLLYVENSILKDDDLRSKFDSVGGVNFEVLMIYLSINLIFSEAVVYWHAINKESKLKKMFVDYFSSKWANLAFKIYPMHFIFLQSCSINLNIHMMKTQMSCILEREKMRQKDMIVQDIVTMSNQIEDMHAQLYILNQIESEIQIIQSSFEREPQCVVELTLFILMKRFRRISLLFTAYFGIPIDLVVGVSSLATILSITKSVYRYIHSKRWPITPNIMGASLQVIATLVLVVSKLFLISAILLNAYYLHPLAYGFNLLLIVMYIRNVSNSEETYYHEFLLTAIAPVFYESSKTFSESKFLRKYLLLAQKHGTIINTVVLQSVTLIIYSAIGAVLRNTMFNFNIDEDYRIKEGERSEPYELDLHLTIQTINTTSSTINGTNLEFLDTLEKAFFEDPLHNFPVYYVLVYGVSIYLYTLMAFGYNRFFHHLKV